MQDGLDRAQHGPHSAGLDHVGGLEPVHERRSDVRLQAGAVPDHRDQRRRDRRAGDQLPGVRRSVAAGGVGLRRPRGRDDRVLALAHQPLRHRDVLDRDPAARPAAWPGLRRAQPAGHRFPAGRFPSGRPPARRRDRVALLRAFQVGTGLPGRLPAAREDLRLRAHRRGPTVVPPHLRSLLPRDLRGRRTHADHPRQPDHRCRGQRRLWTPRRWPRNCRC